MWVRAQYYPDPLPTTTTLIKHNTAHHTSHQTYNTAQHIVTGQCYKFGVMCGGRSNKVVEVVVIYNLFNGFSDVYCNWQYVERWNIIFDQCEKVCCDMCQMLSIVYNDIGCFNDQFSFIGIQVSFVEKMRDVYRDQFNIGQRSLFDLLDMQNELFNVQFAQVNVDIDLVLVYVRSYVGMGCLFEQLTLKQVDLDEVLGGDEFTKFS